MRRRLATLVAVFMFVLMLGASPALAASPASGGFTGPLIHVTLDASTLGSANCGWNGSAYERVYTFTSGTYALDFHADAYDPGPPEYLAAAHWTLRDARATDSAGTSYRVVGGETYNDPAGRLNILILFIKPGAGVVDRISVVARPGFYRDFGTCAP
jgi:hypothetical protein